jgi:hypothetical protein
MNPWMNRWDDKRILIGLVAPGIAIGAVITLMIILAGWWFS